MSSSLFLLTLSLLILGSISQKPPQKGVKKKETLPSSTPSNSVDLERWKKATINLETATDKEPLQDQLKRFDKLREDFQKGIITFHQYTEQTKLNTRDDRKAGTAIFVAEGEQYYLLTARHVLWNQKGAQRELDDEIKRIQTNPPHMQQDQRQRTISRANDKIFNIIFRVPSLDEVVAGKFKPDNKFLMNIGAGVPDLASYTFSAPQLDLAIISLNQRDIEFAKELLALGYKPIPTSDIEDGPSKEGADVFSVGYPLAMSAIDRLNLDMASANWNASFISLPNFSFGRVSMLHSHLHFFWVDMSIYPGNSGGPIVENNKLVGIVSEQGVTPLDASPNVQIRIPFGKAIKAKFVKELIAIQLEKDKKDAEFSGRSKKK